MKNRKMRKKKIVMRNLIIYLFINKVEKDYIYKIKTRIEK